MAEYTFKITQPATTYFRGEISIKAKTEKEAINKASKLTQSQIERLATDWELADEGADADGFIEIYDENGKVLNS